MWHVYAESANGFVMNLPSHGSYIDAFREVLAFANECAFFITDRNSAVDGGIGREFVMDHGNNGAVYVVWN